MTGLWARENSQYPGKEVDGGSQKKEIDALAHSHPRLAHAVALPRSLSDIDAELAHSQRTHLRYSISYQSVLGFRRHTLRPLESTTTTHVLKAKQSQQLFR